MRETKKLPAVLLALVLFFTLSVPALAAAGLLLIAAGAGKKRKT